MIGIIGALEEEVSLFKHDMKIQKIENIAKCEYVSGLINGKEVVITRCGMGKVNASTCCSIMIERYKPDLIINTGVGGALDSKLNVLDIAVAEEVVQHDYDLVPLGYKLGQVDNFDSPIFKCEKNVIQYIKKLADKAGLPSYFVRFATGDRFIEKEADKNFIVNNFKAQVCDMESGAIAQTCSLYNVKFASIRTISDSAGAMEFNKFLKIASTHSVFIVEELIGAIDTIIDKD